MYNRLIPFLVDNNLLTEAQIGFRKNKSTDTASQTFIESIQDALDRGPHAIVVFDLSKAYDVINHDILLDKLNAYGIRGEANLWFKLYLLNSLQFVEIKETDCSNSVKNSYISSCKNVEHSVLQGSVLGKLFFLLYINYIIENIQGAKLVLFAVDKNLLITRKDEHDLQHKIINVIKGLEIWFQKKNLIMNTGGMR
jgi:hypothetical protein